MSATLVCYRLFTRLIFAVFLSQPALAENTNDDLEEKLLFANIPSVFSASKYEQKLTEAPARISIVTADEIQRYGHRTFLDILNSIPGFQSTYDRSYSYVGVRGFGIAGDYNTRILVLVDGHRINESIYDSAALDHGFSVDIDLIDRVEVVRGPASSMYGNNAFLGVINVITKRGRDLQTVEVSAAAGSQDSIQARVSYGQRYDNGMEVLVSATGFDSDGNNRLYYPEFDDPATNNGIAENADYIENRNLFAKMAYGGFSFTTSYKEYIKGIPTASYGTIFNDTRTNNLEGHTYFDIKYEHFTDNGTDVSARLYYDDYWYEGEWAYDYAEPGDPSDEVIFFDLADGNWWGTEIQLSSELFDNHYLSLGIEYRENIKEHQNEFDIYGVYLDSNTKSDMLSVYAQDEFRLHKNLIINIGLRLDHFLTFGRTANPRLAAIWQVDEPTTLKFLYGTAFRAPNPYEIYFEDTAFQKQSKDLEPETIETFEIIMDRRLSKNVDLVASIFHNTIEDLLIRVSDPVDNLLVIINDDGKTTADGLELELRGHWENGWSTSSSFTYQKAEDADGVKLANSPETMLKFNAIAPLGGDNFSAGLEMQYESERKTLANNETDARLVTNLTFFSQNWLEGANFSVSVYNLFDEDYAVPGAEEHLQDRIALDGRTFRLKVDYAF